jgi:hypothetical protein
MVINCEDTEYIEFFVYVSYAPLWHGYGENTFHLYRLCKSYVMAVVFTDFMKVSIILSYHNQVISQVNALQQCICWFFNL